MAQAGAGLRVLHEQGIVHRDLKPQNLLLRSGGSAGDRLLVADLGVAKALLHASGLTQVVGTPAYMAPEQAAGTGIDVRADVHSLAAVAYHLLTGSPVREGTIAEVARAALPRPPSELADLPAAVDDVLLRALQRDPADRWPDVGSFVDALTAAVPAVSDAPAVSAEAATRWESPAVRTAEEPAAEPAVECRPGRRPPRGGRRCCSACWSSWPPSPRRTPSPRCAEYLRAAAPGPTLEAAPRHPCGPTRATPPPWPRTRETDTIHV